MSAAALLGLLLALQTKHLFADFWWQTPWMLRNKGRYGHPGGIAHALAHGGLSAAVLGAFAVPLATLAALAIAEIVLHYHIDWAKMRLGTRAGHALDEPRFWRAIGLDQWAHHATYLGMAAILVL